MTKWKTLLMIGAAGVALSACADDDAVDDPTPAPTPTPAGFEDQFGDSFGAAFRIDANGDPIDPQDGDIIDLSLTDDPVDVPNP